MTSLPVQVMDLAKRPDSCKILTTINEDGSPHSIVCGTLFVPSPEEIGIGRVWLGRTCENLSRDSRASFIVWGGVQAYEIGCRFRCATSEHDALDEINEKLDRINVKASSVLIFDVESVYDEGFGPDVGKKIA